MTTDDDRARLFSINASSALDDHMDAVRALLRMAEDGLAARDEVERLTEENADLRDGCKGLVAYREGERDEARDALARTRAYIGTPDALADLLASERSNGNDVPTPEERHHATVISKHLRAVAEGMPGVGP